MSFNNCPCGKCTYIRRANSRPIVSTNPSSFSTLATSTLKVEPVSDPKPIYVIIGRLPNRYERAPALNSGLLNSKDFSRFNRAALSSSNVKAKPNAFPPIQQLPTVNNPWFKYTSSFGTFAARTWKIEPVLGPNPIYGIQVPTVNKPQFKVSNLENITTKPLRTPDVKRLHFELLNLDDNDLITNTEAFECAICFTEIAPGTGVVLKNCLHQFCKQCLADAVEHSNEAEIKCPYGDGQYICNFTLRDREIKALVKPEIYERHLFRSITQAENAIQNSFHCKTPDCLGWCVYEDDVDTFRCPACFKENCFMCQAIHEGMTCELYQQMKTYLEGDKFAGKTEEAIKDMILNGEAMNCPGCKVLIVREEGCDWLACSACRTEICWVTKGPRWGPGGRNDITGGCRCGVNGIKCHPKCKYCH